MFAAWRNDPSFELNQPQYQKASILVAGPDFGTGSSREHAVWALQNYGFKVVLSSRFADIFRGNSQKMGLLTVILTQEEIEQIWQVVESKPDTQITVDLASKTITYAGKTLSFATIGDCFAGQINCYLGIWLTFYYLPNLLYLLLGQNNS